MLIYRIINTINGKSYVGQTTRDPECRFEEHLKDKSHCIKMVSAVIKYGREAFHLEILDEADSIEELNKKEIYYIQKFDSVNNGYNILSGGYNRNMPQHIKDKISKTMAGIKKPEHVVAKLKEANLKPVFQYDKDGKFVQQFNSVQDADEYLGVKRSNIGYCCEGKRRLSNGFQWKWEKHDSIPSVRPKTNPNLNRKRVA